MNNRKKTGGRQMGTPNKVTGELRTVITDFLNGEFENVKKEFKKLEPKDKLKFYTDLLQYGLPKLQATSLDFDFNKLSDEQLNEVINKLIQKSSE
jgi:hypothetical protein